MSLRLLALFLAFVLGWSSFTIPEQRLAAIDLSPAVVVVSLADVPAHAEKGSLDDHHLDDLPSQVHSESWGELPGLLAEPIDGPRVVTTLKRPFAHRDDQRPDPWLQGLQRPPCEARVRA